MEYYASAVTDVGTSKENNQDSVCIRIANTKNCGQVVMAVVCDGMGGLSKGELASATLIRAFVSWFEHVLPKRLRFCTLEELSEEIRGVFGEENRRILEFGRRIHANIGTTCSALLVVGNRYAIIHVGDTRIYALTDLESRIRQLTEDQTYVAREVRLGNLTPEQAKTHAKRSVLLQCIGASRAVEPQIAFGEVHRGTLFLLCSDGFRHVLDEGEMYDGYFSIKPGDKRQLRKTSKKLVELVKKRGERDNISVAVVQCADGSVSWWEKVRMGGRSREKETRKAKGMIEVEGMGRVSRQVSNVDPEQTAELPFQELQEPEELKILQSITMIHTEEVI